MSGLQDFLTPFSHLIFANRDKVIVLLAALLGWFTIQLLITRWRNERLERDLANAKSAPSGSSGRRYAPSAQAEEPQAESGVLPPVKGGRTYARNLGTALSKAGISAPQIYSPPSPPGWAPNANPAQPGMGQPAPGTPYAPQNVPWGAPAQPPPSPWGYPAGPGRAMPGPAPNAVPFYQPQAPLPQQPAMPMQPMTPPPSGPGFYGPPPVAPPFGQPAFSPATSGPAAPAPPNVPPGVPAGPPVAPLFGGTPQPGPAVAEPATPDGGRRGKPKRRRFNFNVLENLEKMVQPKAAEPAPPMGWTPPVAAPTTPAPAAPSAPPVSATPESSVASQPAPAAEAAGRVKEAPAAEAASPVKEAAAESPSLPLRFGPDVEEEPDAEKSETAEKAPEPSVSIQAEAAPIAEAEPEPEREAEPEPEAQPKAQPKPDARKSMRSMLFGEEPAAAPDIEGTAEATQSASEPASPETSWQSGRWAPAQEASPSPESETPPAEPAAEEPVVEDAPEALPVAEASEPQAFGVWKPTFAPKSEPEAETVASAEPEAPPAEIPATVAADAGDKPSAGTVVIIEDDETAASYYATLFRGNGYQVEVANDGVSGVDLCTRVQPQVILLDVMMPRQNGILVLQTLRASDETKTTPVVVMSNFSEPTLIKRAIQLGALEYVIKTQVEGPALLNAMPRWMNREKAFAAA
jgi:CheY-like chemotaxis protein